jgi:hypothetical protein
MKHQLEMHGIQEILLSYGVKTYVRLHFRCKNVNDKNTDGCETVRMPPTPKPISISCRNSYK